MSSWENPAFTGPPIIRPAPSHFKHMSDYLGKFYVSVQAVVCQDEKAIIFYLHPGYWAYQAHYFNSREEAERALEAMLAQSSTDPLPENIAAEAAIARHRKAEW